MFLGYAVSQLICVSSVCNMLRYCQSSSCAYHHRYHLYMVPVAPIITGITFVFTLHMPSIYIVRSAYSRNSSASFLITFLSSPEIATIYCQTHSLVIITDNKYDVRFVVRDGSAGLHLSSPKFFYLTSRTGFC